MKTQPEQVSTNADIDVSDPQVREILNDWRSELNRRERELWHPKAAFSEEHIRRDQFDGDNDYRPPYKHDLDRIIHSKAYIRYVDKTQVVYLIDNDHISSRSIHVQLVSSFAKGLAAILGYNIDLVESIALGHDVGHTPFGHEGEDYLSELSQEHGCGAFAHPWQSCRLLRDIEPLNLGLNVYDGFLCHDGGRCGNTYKPNFNKTWDDHVRELKQKQADPNTNIWPATLEGCLVKLCDTVSYLARDIEDAISLKIITRDMLPDTILGRSNRTILSKIAADIIKHSYQQDHVGVSEEIYEIMGVLRTFNFEKIYTDPRLKTESKKIRRSYRLLFDLLLEEGNRGPEDNYLWRHYLHNKSEKYIETTSLERQVIDFISGMTDGYFVRTIEALAVPSDIDLTS